MTLAAPTAGPSRHPSTGRAFARDHRMMGSSGRITPHVVGKPDSPGFPFDSRAAEADNVGRARAGRGAGSISVNYSRASS